MNCYEDCHATEKTIEKVTMGSNTNSKFFNTVCNNSQPKEVVQQPPLKVPVVIGSSDEPHPGSSDCSKQLTVKRRRKRPKKSRRAQQGASSDVTNTVKCAEPKEITPQPCPEASLEGTAASSSEAQPFPSRTYGEETETWESLKSTLHIEHSRQQIPRIPWLKDWELNMEDYYVDLSIECKDDKKIRSLDLKEIFNSSSTRILIEGPAGYGKSTLAHKLCFDHANGENYIRHFKVVILLPLRKFEGTLEEMITKTLQLNDYSTDQVITSIKQNQNKILFILDGFDELSKDKYDHVIGLLKCKQLPKATVIVTSREGFLKLVNVESDSSVTNLLHCMDRRILIKGVTTENRKRFLRLYLKGYCSKKCDSLITLIGNKFGSSENESDVFEKKSLFECPVFLLLLTTVVTEETGMDSLHTKTQVYKRIFNFLLRITKAKAGIETGQTFDFFEFNHNSPPSHVDLFSRFGSMTGEALYKHKYSFTEDEILTVCANDRTILKLGILTQNDFKRGPIRQMWYEPIHLTFLEFLFAYHIWVSVVCCPNSFPFVYRKNNEFFKVLLQKPHSLVLSFVFGLCGEQLHKLMPALMLEHDRWLEDFVKYCNHNELLAESKLTWCELAKAFLPLVPTNYVVEATFIDDSLLKEILTQAVVTKSSHIIVEGRYFHSNKEQSNLPRRVVLDETDTKKWENHQDWLRLLPNQNFLVSDCYSSRFVVTICEAPLQKQLSWLSKLITIEGSTYTDKSIHEIKYHSTPSQIVETFNEITNLIQQEKLLRVEFDACSNSLQPPQQQWTKFLACTNHSLTLLDMKLEIFECIILCIYLGGEEGKTWSTITLRGFVVPLVGSLLGSWDPYTITWDLKSFIRELPNRIQTLHIESIVVKFMIKCIFIQHVDRSKTHNLRVLYITFSSDSLLQSRIWEYLQNLHVFAIGLWHTLEADKGDIITTILSVISHCRFLKRLELWDGCTEEFLKDFLQRFSSEKYSAISDGVQSEPTLLHLNTLMLSPEISSNNENHENTILNLVKNQLLSGRLQRLWISHDRAKEGCARQEFIKSFASAEGFTCKLSWKREALWKLIHWRLTAIFEITVNSKMLL